MNKRIKNKIKSRLGYRSCRKYKNEVLKPYLDCEKEYKKWAAGMGTELDVERELWEMDF